MAEARLQSIDRRLACCIAAGEIRQDRQADAEATVVAGTKFEMPPG